MTKIGAEKYLKVVKSLEAANREIGNLLRALEYAATAYEELSTRYLELKGKYEANEIVLPTLAEQEKVTASRV